MATLDDKFEGFVEEATKEGINRRYFVREGKIYEQINDKIIQIPGCVKNGIAYKYGRGNYLKEIGRV